MWGSYTATLTAVSNSYGMDVTAHKQSYADQTLSGVAAKMAARHNLAINVGATDSKALNYVQYGETDFSFLHRVVDDHGAWMRPNERGWRCSTALGREHDGAARESGLINSGCVGRE